MTIYEPIHPEVLDAIMDDRRRGRRNLTGHVYFESRGGGYLVVSPSGRIVAEDLTADEAARTVNRLDNAR